MSLPITKRIARIILVCISVLAILLFGVWVFASFVLADDLEFPDGNLMYAVIVRSDTIRNFPRIGLTDGPASFLYRARDGTAPGEIVLRHPSMKTPIQLVDEYLMHCRRKGYDPIIKEQRLLKSDFACDAPDYRIEIVLRGNETRTDVAVYFLEQ